MAIYNIDDFRNESGKAHNNRESTSSGSAQYLKDQIRGFSMGKEGGRFFSGLAARLFFFLLLIADITWGIYVVALLLVKLVLNVATLFLAPALRKSLAYSCLCVKRALVCFIALTIAIFSPGLGIMFACLYFLTYDRNGVEDIVPSSLRDQFRDFFPGS